MNIEDAANQISSGGEPVKLLASAMKDSDTMMAKMVVKVKDVPVFAVIVVHAEMCSPVLKVLEAMEDIYELDK